ncbi:uncharacterized protein LOC114561375 [Perca flavescens]|uniref:uncharacterized protein LOC114561375 n=1 Tax=Perca flavescens TaxID=8167 RepID=UPI00106E1F28|nr:uncharacterized protein LOC114561375 [Perca flavescens]
MERRTVVKRCYGPRRLGRLTDICWSLFAPPLVRGEERSCMECTDSLPGLYSRFLASNGCVDQFLVNIEWDCYLMSLPATGLAERRQRSSRQTAGLHGAARRTKRAGCRIETARTTGVGGNTLRVPVGRFSAGVGSSVPDKLRLPRGSEIKIWRRLSDMASCLISANQDERKTTPKLAAAPPPPPHHYKAPTTTAALWQWKWSGVWSLSGQM